MFDPAATRAQQLALVAELYAAEDCCLDSWTAHIRGLNPSAMEFMEPENLRMVKEIMDCMPTTNIRSEQRFAAAHTRMRTASGHVGVPATLAADHILAESHAVLNAGLV